MHERTTRLAAVTSVCLMAIASLGGPALACATAMRGAMSPSAVAAQPADAPGTHAHRHAAPMSDAAARSGDARGGDDPSPTHEPCEPGALDCCAALTPCAAAFDIDAPVGTHPNPSPVATVVAPAAVEPTSLITAPDPPPPKA